MPNLTVERTTEMLNDLEDYETEWTKFETDFLMNLKDNLEKYEDKFKFFGNQEITFQGIYKKYVKEASV
jgi:hypothetical protein